MTAGSNTSHNTSASGQPQAHRSRVNTTEDGHLDSISRKYEAELLQKRKERQEARQLRLTELEKEQRELDNGKGDGEPSAISIPSSRHSHDNESQVYGINRRTTASSAKSEKDLKQALQDLNTKYDKVRMENEQLENDKSMLYYNVGSLKDTMEEYELAITSLKRDNKVRNSTIEDQRKQLDQMERRVKQLQGLVKERDQVIKESGLVAMTDDQNSISGVLTQDTVNALSAKSTTNSSTSNTVPLHLSLDQQIRAIALERDTLLEECQNLQDKLDSSETTPISSSSRPYSSTSVSEILRDPAVELHIAEVQRDAQRQIADYKLRYQKAEQDIAALEANCNRLNGQVQRYKESAEHAEKSEDSLKAERRKLMRENRTYKDRIEELETTRDHLEKRFEKLRQARNALTHPHN